MRRVVVGVAVATGLLGLAACGQKGPLYLPDTGGDVVTRPMQVPPADGAAPIRPDDPSPARTDAPSPSTQSTPR